MQEEQILVIPSEVIELNMNLKEGINPFRMSQYAESNPLHNLRPHMKFMPRGEMEKDENYRQLIPYVVFICGDKIFTYTRSKGQGEARLLGKNSIGVGGHINPIDGAADGADLYVTGLMREMQEELTVTANVLSHRMIGFINDTSNAVGRVHLGVLHFVVLDSEGVKAKEESMQQCEFVAVAEAGSIYTPKDSYEVWSQMVLNYIVANGGEAYIASNFVYQGIRMQSDWVNGFCQPVGGVETSLRPNLTPEQRQQLQEAIRKSMSGVGTKEPFEVAYPVRPPLTTNALVQLGLISPGQETLIDKYNEVHQNGGDVGTTWLSCSDVEMQFIERIRQLDA